MSLSVLLAVALFLLPLPQVVETAPQNEAAEAPPTQPAEPLPAREALPDDPIELLLDEIDRLDAVILDLRRQLAECDLRRNDAERELEEMRQFIRDHREFGEDFEKYREIREIARTEAEQQRIAEARQRLEAERAERRSQRRIAQEERRERQAEMNRLQRYRQAGFSHLGLDVFLSKMAFSYLTRDSSPFRVDYDPLVGLYYRPGGASEIDYNRMTFSGSVLNASDEVLNIGVAIAFFDELGNQVGGETIQVNNARPDVPYPFTATIEMALNRPFATSTSYVLYADRVAQEEPGE
jgi:hypothetical protein